MKKTISFFRIALPLFLCILFSIVTLTLNAQSLAFSKVKLVSNVPDTVPVGKVWKVEQIIPAVIWNFGGANSPNPYQIFINGNSRFGGHSAWTDDLQNSSSSSSIHVPIWLPAGTRLQAGTNVGEISVIEFTVVP